MTTRTGITIGTGITTRIGITIETTLTTNPATTTGTTGTVTAARSAQDKTPQSISSIKTGMVSSKATSGRSTRTSSMSSTEIETASFLLTNSGTHPQRPCATRGRTAMGGRVVSCERSGARLRTYTSGYVRRGSAENCASVRQPEILTPRF